MPSRTEPLRVLHVIPSLSMVHGGPSRAMRNMEAALRHEGVQVVTATTDDDGPGKRLEVERGRRINHEGSVRWYFPKSTEFYKVSWSFAAWILREARNFDVIHVHALFSFTSVIAAWAARRAGVPYVIRPLGVLAPYGVSQRRPSLKAWSMRLVEGPLVRDAAAVHFTSESEKEQAAALGLRFNPVVIPLGVEGVAAGSRARFLESHPSVRDQFRILYLSRLDPKKNFEALAHAVSNLVARGMNPALLVAGSGDSGYCETLRQLVRELGIADHVHFLGHLSGEAHADALASADVFALPSFSENFGIAVAESLMAGVPCVLSHGVAIAPAVAEGGAGTVVDPRSESLADAIEAFIRSPEKRRQAASAAAELARRNYSVPAMGASLHALYRSLQACPRVAMAAST